MIEKEAIASSVSSSRPKKTKVAWLRIIVWLVVLVIIIGGVWYSYKKFGFGDGKTASSTPETVMTESEISSLLKKVGRLMILPDEKPTIATIQDSQALASQQQFFVGSENGDKLIVFINARKAVIYREREGKIVNVGPVVTDQAQQQTSTQTISAPTTPTPKK